jgi:threonine synthase
VGNAGNIAAYWKGYREYRIRGRIRSLPVMAGFQARGADPIVRGRVIARPRTVASAIRIGNPVSWTSATAACRESCGVIQAVTDREILSAYRELAEREGVFVEPASAAPVAGIKRLAARGVIRRRATVVCTLTGHGLKDPEWAIATAKPPVEAAPTVDAILNLVL